MAGGDWKAMFKGIQDNDLELVKYYLKIGIDPNYQHPEYLALPLAESIRYNHMEMAELLLKYGASSAIIEEESGISVLEIAKRMKKRKIVKLLNKYLEDKPLAEFEGSDHDVSKSMSKQTKYSTLDIVAVIFCLLGCSLLAASAFVKTEYDLFNMALAMNGVGLAAFLFGKK